MFMHADTGSCKCGRKESMKRHTGAKKCDKCSLYVRKYYNLMHIVLKEHHYYYL